VGRDPQPDNTQRIQGAIHTLKKQRFSMANCTTPKINRLLDQLVPGLRDNLCSQWRKESLKGEMRESEIHN
jgi:hypothetical protein